MTKVEIIVLGLAIIVFLFGYVYRSIAPRQAGGDGAVGYGADGSNGSSAGYYYASGDSGSGGGECGGGDGSGCDGGGGGD